MGMGMGVNPYPPVYMGDPVGLFLCRGYGYGVVRPGGYLPIAISSYVSNVPLVIPRSASEAAVNPSGASLRTPDQ
jgi:hypothetical protein